MQRAQRKVELRALYAKSKAVPPAALAGEAAIYVGRRTRAPGAMHWQVWPVLSLILSTKFARPTRPNPHTSAETLLARAKQAGA
jgi:hypothetical protein